MSLCTAVCIPGILRYEGTRDFDHTNSFCDKKVPDLACLSLDEPPDFVLQQGVLKFTDELVDVSITLWAYVHSQHTGTGPPNEQIAMFEMPITRT
jgi:hypothetical protein